MNVPDISRVGIVGSGTMGSRIAYRCMVSGLEIYLHDSQPDALLGAVERVRTWVQDATSDGRLAGQAVATVLSRLHPCETLRECVGDVDLVIEAVPEKVDLKRRVFSEIDRRAAPRALIATNSSSIPCSRIAGATQRPAQVFNINFSDPRHDNLVEVMKGAQTDDATIRAGMAFVKKLHMVPIVTWKEITGFTFNRIWRAIKREALHLVGDGYSDPEDIDRAWMLEYGTSYGPFGLMDKIGLDVIRDIELLYYRESGEERDRPPEFLDRMVAEGRLGVKTGRGFYIYPNPRYTQAGWLTKDI